MTSREAFEAWADARDATHGGRLRNAANDFDYPLGRLLDECWQAAIPVSYTPQTLPTILLV